jgi:peroxiredoxin
MNPQSSRNPKLKPGDRAPGFNLPGIDGQRVRLADEVGRHAATVVLFICNHCPYVKAYVPRLIELQKEFASGDKGVRFIGISSNDATTYPDDSFDNMKKYAREWGLSFPYVHDEDQTVAMAYGAERTPEIFVLDRQGVCQYEGGVDDNYQDPGKVTRRPLREALAALTQGRPVPQPQTYAIGCTIKWKKA